MWQDLEQDILSEFVDSSLPHNVAVVRSFIWTSDDQFGFVFRPDRHDPAKKAAYMKAYWSRPEAKERHRLRMAQYRALNRDTLNGERRSYRAMKRQLRVAQPEEQGTSKPSDSTWQSG